MPGDMIIYANIYSFPSVFIMPQSCSHEQILSEQVKKEGKKAEQIS